jgi:hypothetical protein
LKRFWKDPNALAFMEASISDGSPDDSVELKLFHRFGQSSLCFSRLTLQYPGTLHRLPRKLCILCEIELLAIECGLDPFGRLA